MYRPTSTLEFASNREKHEFVCMTSIISKPIETTEVTHYALDVSLNIHTYMKLPITFDYSSYIYNMLLVNRSELENLPPVNRMFFVNWQIMNSTKK